jgi:hypothetical protein
MGYYGGARVNHADFIRCPQHLMQCKHLIMKQEISHAPSRGFTFIRVSYYIMPTVGVERVWSTFSEVLRNEKQHTDSAEHYQIIRRSNLMRRLI